MNAPRKPKRKPISFKRPCLSVQNGLLGKRSESDWDTLITSLAIEKDMHAQTRVHIAAMLFLDFFKMSKERQDRFAAIMNTGTPDERRRIGCLLAKT